MKTLKKALACMMVVVMLISAVPLSGFVGLEWPELNFGNIFSKIAAAADTVDSGTCGTSGSGCNQTSRNWRLDSDGVLTISGSGAMTNYESSSDVPWYSHRESIKKVIIENGVTNIGDFAFYSCTNLASVTIADSVTSIGSWAFYDCDSLASVTFGENSQLQSIGDYVFEGCDSLASITIPANVTSIGNDAFRSCSSLASVTFGENSQLTTIGHYAFCDCDSLASITIPASVTSIGDVAFENCVSLASVDFGDNSKLTSIGHNAFRDCDSLASITIPASVATIDKYAFCDCDSLASITVEPNNKYYCSDESGVLFNKNKTTLIQYPIGNTRTSYTIPDSVTSIGDYAFIWCTSLASITIPNSVTSIGDNAFFYCTSLASITIPASVATIDKYAFFNCTSLASITIPASVATIDKYAFCECDSLASITVEPNNKYYCSDESGVLFNKNKTTLIQYPIGNTRTSYTIPDSVTSIGDYAFNWCTSLASITIPASVTIIGNAAFYLCTSLASITVLNPECTIYDDSSTIDSGAKIIGFSGSTAESYASKYNRSFIPFVDSGTCGENVQWALDSEGTLIIYGTGAMTDYAFSSDVPWYSRRNSIKKVIISNGVTGIGDNAFMYCESLTSVTIPNRVTTIGDSAFSSCVSLASITIPASVTSIGKKVFSNCQNLTHVNFGDNCQLTNIAYGMFSSCVSLANITIPDSVTTIDNYAFSGCESLASITIPDSVTSIGNYAFSSCDSLVNVDFGDNSQLQSIGDYAFYTCYDLANITLPESLTSIGSWAFYVYGSPENIVIPAPSCTIYDSAYAIFSGAVIYGYANSPAQSYAEKYGRTFRAIKQYGTCGENLTWVLDNDGLLSIFGTGAMTDFPNYSDAPWYSHRASIKQVVIKNGITGIGDFAFYDCTAMISVSIADSVTSIGKEALYNTAWYNKQPDGVVYAGNVAYDYKGTMPVETIIALEDGTTGIAAYAFENYINLTAVTIPDSVSTIGNHAFYNCSKLGNAYFYGNVPASFGSNVFDGTKSDFGIYVFDLAEETGWTQPTWNGYNVYLSNSADLVTKTLDADNKDSAGVKYIVNPATMTAKVSGYEGTATEVTVPCAVKKDGVKYTVTAVDYEAFRNKGLTQVLLPNTIESIGAYAFAENPSLTEFDIRNKTVSLGDGAFMDCTGLASVNLNHVLTAIGKNTFKNCSSLKTISLGSKITTIGEAAFYNCRKLSAVNLENITSIGAQAFYDCDNLKKITLGSNIATIGDSAFADCGQLTAAHFTGNHPTTVGTDIFGGTENDKFYVFYPPSHETWQGKVKDARWNGYQAVPFNAVTQMAIDKDNLKFYIIRVANEAGEFLEGATVSLSGVSDTTYADGYAYLPTPDKATVPLKITMLGYHPIETDYSLEAVPLAFFTLSEDPSTVTPLTCNDKNITTGTAQINVAADETAEIVVAGYSQFPIIKYEIIQNGNAIASSTSSTLRVHNSKFIPDEDVYVVMYTADGKTVSEKLNIIVINQNGNFIIEPFLDFSLKVPFDDSIPVVGGMKTISLRDENALFDTIVTNDKILLSLGYEIDNKDDSPGIITIINDYLKNPKKLLNAAVKLFYESNRSLSFVGYIVVDLVGDDIVISDQNINLIYATEDTAKIPLPFKIGIIEASLDLTISTNGDYDITLAIDDDNVVFNDLIADILLDIKTSPGLKIPIFASGGVYGSLGLGLRMKLFPEQELYSTTLQGSMGIWYKLLFCKRKDIPIYSGKTTIFHQQEPSGGGGGGGGRWSLRVGASSDSEILSLTAPDLTDLASYEHISGDYLNARSSWYPSGTKRVGASAQAVADVTASAQLLQSSAYTGIDPQIITCGETTMMVYLDYDVNLDDNNYQKLVYSIYSEEGKIWSEPVNISEDSRFEDYPSVAADDRFIYVAYTKANREMTDEDKGDETEEGIAHGLTTYASVMETAVSVYDTETGTFVDEVYLTENDHLDIMPVVKVINGIPTVLWIENTANDMFLMNGTNVLYKARLIDGNWVKSLVLTDCGLVKSLDMGTLGGKQYIVLCIDEDNDLETVGDSNIYLVDENSGIFCLTEQAGAYFMPTFATFDGVAQLVWYQDGNLCFITAPDGEISTILETPSDKLSPHFKLIENNGRYDILFSANNDSETDEEGNLLDPGSDIYGIFYDNGWGNPVKITDAGNSYYINAFDAYYKDDELLIPYLRTLVTFYENGSGYTKDCDLYSTLVDFNGNITVSDPVFADSDLFDDDKLTVSLTINNSMNRKINGLRFTVTAPDGSEVDTLTTDSVILSGANEDVEFTFTLPDEITEGAYTITAVPLNGSDADESDNSVFMCLLYPDLYPDLVVNAKQTIIGTKTYIHVSVENTGNASSDGTLNIRINHRDEVIHSLPFDSIAPGEKKLFEITTDASFFDGDAKTGLVCVAAENENDVNTNNNKAYISLFDPSEDEIDTDSVAKQSSVYPLHFSYDKNGGEVTTVELNANTNSFEGIENVDNAAYTLADNKLTFNTAYLNSLAEGEQTFLFTFRDKNNDLQKISVAVYISDTTPEEITGEISIDGNAKVNGILSVNTANLSENTAVFTCQWYSDGSAIQGATQSTYAVRSADVGKSISVTITASGNYAGTFTSPSIAITCEHVFKNWITLTPATCTTDGTQKGSCVCGATSQRDVTAPGHAWSTTCTSNGDGENNTHYQTCTRTGCDATSDAVAHTWNEGVVAPDPTCEDAGIRTFTCTASGCGATFTEAVVANGHSYGEWINEVAATCINTGVKGHYECSVCHKNFDAEKAELTDLTIAINGSNHVTTTEHAKTDATCLTVGYTAGTFCDDCKTWISGHEEIPALAHKNKVHHEKVDATCVATGTIEYWSCPDCGKNFSDEECNTAVENLTIEINPDNHDLKTTEAKAPTCTEIGWDAYVTCQREGCNYTTYVEKAANGHAYDLTKGVAAEAGKHTVTCPNCAEGTEGHTKVVDCTYGEGVVTAPTCTKNGYTTHTCTACGYSYTDNATEKLGHKFSDWAAIGNDKHERTCTVCTDEEDRVETADCTYGEWTETTKPTCTEKGEKAHTCSVCTNTVTAEVEALGHAYGDADCLNPATCTRCGATTGEALGHDFTVFVETVDYTCTEKGYDIYKCTRCDATENKNYTDAACRPEKDYTVTVKATCEADGEKSIFCFACDKALVTTVIEKRAHVYKDNGVKTSVTCVAEGVMNTICTNEETAEYAACAHESTRVIPVDKDAHKWETEYTVDKKASCEEAGSKSYHCEYCDTINTESVVEIAKREHNLVDTTVALAPTCSATGIMNQKCDCAETAEYEACDYTTTRVMDKVADAHKAEAEYIQTVAPTCSAVGEEKLYCEYCDAVLDTREVAIDADAHKWETEYTVDKKASCDAAGTKSYHCEYCDAINADSVVEIVKREHNLVDTTVALAPTCSATGIMNQKCDCAETAEYEACDYTTTRVMDKVADAHKAEAEYIQTVAPTCSAVGEEKLYCKYCDAVLDTREVAIDADAHKWETEYTVDVKASCDEAGSKSYHCEYCDAINAESVVEIAKREHNLVDTTVALAPTCSATGTMNQKCDCAETAEYEACDYTTTRVMDKVADAHKAEAEYIQTIAPTCSAVGEEKLYCEYCDAVLDTREVAIDADAHKWETEYTVDKKASCDAAGSKSYHCEYCDAINADSVVEITKREHNLVDTTTALAPTCSATGIMNQKCDCAETAEYEACAYTTTRVMDKVADAHKAEAEYIQTIAPTCSAVGEEKLYCEYCDAVLDTREVAIDADAHKWETEYTVDKKASCDAAGTKSYHCEYCDAINTESVVEIAKREHNLVDTTVAKAPTCSATGIMNQKCDHVGSDEYEACTYTTTRVMDKVADAHKWETEYTVDKKASCDTAGSKSYHCEYCDAINADSVVEIAKREHNLVDTTVAKAPTCTEDGVMNQKCDHVGSDEYEACTYTTTREIPVPGHSWGEWTVSIPATYIQEGEEIRTCNKCGTTETHTLDKLPLPDSIVIAEPYTTVKVSDGFVVTSVNKTVADLLAVSNATNVLTATGENADAATVLATGMQLVITDGETVVSCMEIVILGDVDGDGIIAAADARMALRASVGLDVLNAARQKAADTDTSNTIAASDAREILRAAVGLDDPVVWFEKS